MRLRRVVLVFVVAIVFFFFVPVVPITVSALQLLPTANQCFGASLPAPYEGMSSLSYKIFGLAVSGSLYGGIYGLVYVPNNGQYTVQFPPFGFKSGMICG